MAGLKLSPFAAMAVVLALSLSLYGKCGAEVNVRHHVVCDDRGWDPSSDVASWAAGRIFLVGDSLWFTYSAAEEKIVELGSKDEYEACDLSNPIRMYTDGISRVSLDGEGIRYFVSGNADNCKKGLKIPVEVKPQLATVMKPLTHSVASSGAAAPLLPPPTPVFPPPTPVFPPPTPVSPPPTPVSPPPTPVSPSPTPVSPPPTPVSPPPTPVSPPPTPVSPPPPTPSGSGRSASAVVLGLGALLGGVLFLCL